jgi:MerR family transcriptional regulator/heat shock protein HspR
LERMADTLYSIGEAADILGVSVPTLRLYEREGLIIPLRKSSKHRLFTRRDIERICCLRETINGKKVSIAGIKRLLSLLPCWKIKNCPSEARVQCPAFLSNEGACWTLRGKAWECATATCRDCLVYAELSDCSTLKHTIVTLTTSSQTQVSTQDQRS